MRSEARATACRAALFAAAAMVGACGPETHTGLLPVGRYAYHAAHPVPDGGDSIRLEGLLVITYASGDSVDGRWDVSRMNPELEASRDADGAVEIRGHPTYFGTLTHRFRPAGGSGFACEGEYSWVSEDGGERSLPLTCSMRASVPPAAGAPAPRSPMVEPIPRDSATAG